MVGHRPGGLSQHLMGGKNQETVGYTKGEMLWYTSMLSRSPPDLAARISLPSCRACGRSNRRAPTFDGGGHCIMRCNAVKSCAMGLSGGGWGVSFIRWRNLWHDPGWLKAYCSGPAPEKGQLKPQQNCNTQGWFLNESAALKKKHDSQWINDLFASTATCFITEWMKDLLRQWLNATFATKTKFKICELFMWYV